MKFLPIIAASKLKNVNINLLSDVNMRNTPSNLTNKLYINDLEQIQSKEVDDSKPNRVAFRNHERDHQAIRIHIAPSRRHHVHLNHTTQMDTKYEGWTTTSD